eukprot:GEMP01033405.1.p1 GENE.GEMP01033405.1~~GEMP01033405.1.p1  ORF type:complete len:348 (+),score=88.92 GEMP01033405.1:237-1280(+)
MASVCPSEESWEDSAKALDDQIGEDLDSGLETEIEESESDACSIASEDEVVPFMRMTFMNGDVDIIPFRPPTIIDIKVHAAMRLKTLYPCIHILSVMTGIPITSLMLPHPSNVFVVNNTYDDLTALPPRQLIRVMRRHAVKGDHFGVSLCAHIAADHHNANSASSIVRSWIMQSSNTGDDIIRRTLAHSWVDLCGGPRGEAELRSNNVLIDAAGSGDEQLVVALLEARASADAVNANGDTPLMKGARAGHVEIVRQLVEFGADVGARNKHGETAIDPAWRGGHKKITAILIQAGAHVPNSRSANGQPRDFCCDPVAPRRERCTAEKAGAPRLKNEHKSRSEKKKTRR